MIRSLLARGERVSVDPSGWKGRAKQSMRDECDINLILAKYQRTGAITHFSRFSAQYGDAPALDFREALETIREAEKMFAALPSMVRKRFDNDPASFLEFVQDPANAEAMRELGLREAKPTDPPPSRVIVVQDESGASGGDGFGGGDQPAPG